MKRTPIRRKTPLRARPREKAQKSHRPKPWRRAPEDKVSPAERAHVMRRDHFRCVAPDLFRLGLIDEPATECRNTFGDPQTPAEPLTIEHVKCRPAMGIRAPSNRHHMVASCANHNNGDYFLSKHRDAVLVLIAMREGPHPQHDL